MAECETIPNKAVDVIPHAVDVAATADSANLSPEESTIAVLDENIETKKKKKKSKKKPKKVFSIPEQNNSKFRLVGTWPADENSRVDYPPTVPIRQAFNNGPYPTGEIQEYTGNHAYRLTDAEKREAEKLQEEDYNDIRRAAECHRQVRKFAQSFIEPGMSMIDICQKLEAKTLELIEADGLEAGFGFPTGCSLNHVAAHYTPNYGDDTILKQGDLMKLDFGVHVKGRIIDCAFSVAFDSKFDSLIQSTIDGTNAGIKAAGVDARFSEVGAAIQEAIESYEMEINGSLVPIKPVSNLNGHSIERYAIHGGKSVPMVRNAYGTRMEEGEIYAIETFASTGRGQVASAGECSHYMRNGPRAPLRTQSARSLLTAIEKEFGSLPFCRRWLDDRGQPRHLMSLKQLVDGGIVEPYPPLVDIKGSYVSQMEHTILLRPTCKEVVSRGPDY